MLSQALFFHLIDGFQKKLTAQSSERTNESTRSFNGPAKNVGKTFSRLRKVELSFSLYVSLVPFPTTTLTVDSGFSSFVVQSYFFLGCFRARGVWAMQEQCGQCSIEQYVGCSQSLKTFICNRRAKRGKMRSKSLKTSLQRPLLRPTDADNKAD